MGGHYRPNQGLSGAERAGFEDWLTYFRSIGVPEGELQGAVDIYLVDPEGVGPSISFLEVPEAKVVKNRLHLDLDVSGGRDVPLQTRKQPVNAKADRLVKFGGTLLRISDEEVDDRYFVVMQDPEGNEFCLR